MNDFISTADIAKIKGLIDACQTGEELSSALTAIQVAAIKGEYEPDPILLEIITRTDEFPGNDSEMENGRKWAKNMTAFIGSKGMAASLIYWDARDYARLHQVNRGLSALVQTSKTIRGVEFKYWNWNNQLVLTSSETLTLKTEAQRIASQFFEWTEGYSLYFGSRCNGDELNPCTIELARVAASESVGDAYILDQSWEWAGSKGHGIKKDEPDEIELHLHLGDPDDDDADHLAFTAFSPNAGWKP